MFKAKKELEALQRKYDRLQEKCKVHQEEAELLREHLYKIEHGERCNGVYCESCKNSISGDGVEWTTANGTILQIGEKFICALSVPCPDFERKE